MGSLDQAIQPEIVVDLLSLQPTGRNKAISQPTTAAEEVPLPQTPTKGLSKTKTGTDRPGGGRGEWRRRIQGMMKKIQ